MAETHQRRREMARGAGHRFFAYRRAYGPSEFRREYLGSYVTAEEAALAYARSCVLNPPTRGPAKPEPERLPSMTAEEAIRLAQAETVCRSCALRAPNPATRA